MLSRFILFAALTVAVAACSDSFADEANPSSVAKVATNHASCEYKVTDVCGDLGGCSIQSQTKSNGHLKDPRIVRLYWDDPTESYREKMWKALAGAKAFWSRMSEYGIGTGTDGGGYSFPAPTFKDAKTSGGKTYIPDSDIQSWITENWSGITTAANKAGKKLPKPLNDTSASAIFVIHLAANTCTDWFGKLSADCTNVYHNSFYDSTTKNLIAYAVINPVSGSSATDKQLSNVGETHEVQEAATDFDLGGSSGCDGHPGGCGWNVEGKTEGELCDLCAGSGSATIDGYSVAKVYSLAKCACE